MRHVLSTHLFINHRITTVWLERIRAIGVPAIEMFCAKQHLDYTNRAQIDELAHWFRDSQLTLHSLHSPMYNDDAHGRGGPQTVVTLTETVKSKRVAMVDEVKRAIEVSEVIPCRYLIQHIGVLHEEYDERKLDAAFSSLEELNLFAKARGVEILIENIPNRLSTAERIMHFLNTTHLKNGVCLDTGHANLMEGVPAAFDILKDRIRSTHVHDNDGKRDIHWFPRQVEGGTINWNETMELLRSREHQYPLALEVKDSLDFPQPFEAVKKSFDLLEEC